MNETARLMINALDAGTKNNKVLRRERNSLLKERKRLRSILNEVMDCIVEERSGHTPNWKRVMTRVEKYEDAYSPVSDPE